MTHALSEHLIVELLPTDVPSQRKWQQAQKLYTEPLTVPVNLDTLETLDEPMTIVRGIQWPAIIYSDTHVLARILELNGVCAVTYTLADWGELAAVEMDRSVMTVRQTGIPNLEAFLVLCQNGIFFE